MTENSSQDRKPAEANNQAAGQFLLEGSLPLARGDIAFEPADYGMLPLSLGALEAGHTLAMDIYLPMFQPGDRPIKMVLGCPQGRPFRPQWRDRLLAAGQDAVYVPLEQAEELGLYLRELADRVLADPHQPPRQRQLVCRELATNSLRTLFNGDLKPKTLERAVTGFQGLLERVTEDRGLLTNLIELLRADFNVYTHSVNVSLLTMAFARFLALPESRVLTLGLAGMLHDMGQAKLPQALRHKSGPLNELEWGLMRTHPAEGHKMLSLVPAVSLDVLKMVLHHHENSDGSGYPHGLKAKDTPLGARLLRVVDSFDAMTSMRSHRPAMQAFQAASEILAHSAGVFGEDIGPRFVRFLASPFMVA
ncbi:MAG: HD domain-containing protein [Desulfarculus sp.]|nr:HD domain-containing protein [Desulfarculus sp.]